jgi:peptidoglycan/xylan/chitin deacetylase (PgdA/CDA1 family)
MRRTTLILLVLATGVAVACSGGSSAATAQPTNCTVTGTAGPDHLTGTAGDDVICGGAGDDAISGGGGNDIILAGPGADVVRGNDGADRIRGGAGNDRLSGGPGRDELRGERGNDRVSGGRGRDVLFGGAGRDRLAARDNAPYDTLDGGTDGNLCVADAGDNRARCDHPLVASHRRGVPILMYHVIQAPTASTPLPHLYVAPDVFAAQMRWLDRHHYHVVTLQEVYDYWHGAPLPSRPIVVSFDDGFANQYTQAMPILAKHGWSGTLNLALSHYAQRGWGLSQRMVQSMVNHGWELDSHTMTHVALPGLTATELDYQVGRSRSILRHTFHVPVSFFCYPAGLFDTASIAAVRRAGYHGATSTQEGLARWDDPWTLDRVRVSNGDGVPGLAAHLRALGLPT